ncbi:MAG: hypothetical protein LBQ66_12610, partial [Planctomycetaceae bacterium]|nr:hypothetical protein [Planctomycetaceae bacterium]
MEFLKGLVGFFNRLFFDGFDVVRDNRRYSRRRVSQIESLESREMLSVSIGSFSGYASTAGETEIRFTLNTDGTASKIDFTVKSSEASLDPSAIRLYNRTTQSSVNLADIFNSTTQSGGSALLAKADYSIFVKADKGAGNFKLDIFFDDTPIPTLNALNIIVQAAYLQQQSNATWENMREQFNVALFSIAPEYGPTAFNGGRVIDLFPEADVNKDGKIDSNDSAAASAAGNAAGSQKAPPTVSNNSVKNPDTTPPTIAAALNIPAQNGITTSPIINGKITDTSGIKSAIYKINNGSAQNIILAADGSFTILSDSLAEGKYSITIIATDKYDNQVTYTLPEFTYHKFIV